MKTDIDYIKRCGWCYKGCGVWKNSEGQSGTLQRACQIESEKDIHNQFKAIKNLVISFGI